MNNKDFDKLEERSVEVAGIEKPKLISEYLAQFCKTLGDGTQDYLGVRTGLTELDNATLGLDGLMVLGGAPGQGKTSLALQLAYGACELGTPTIFYSLEMPRRAIFAKIFNRLARVKYSNILLRGGQYLDDTEQKQEENNKDINFKGFLSKDDINNLKDAKNKIKLNDRFYLRARESEEADIDFKNVEQEINLVKAEHKADKVLVIIDHLQLFNPGEYKDQIDKEGKLITNFKGISERTGATIVLISQKNKAGLNSEGLQTIKGSVDIIYLADVVMFLNNKNNKDDDLDDIVADFDEPKLEDINLMIQKNRYNAPCKIKLAFSGEYSTFIPRSKDR